MSTAWFPAGGARCLVAPRVLVWLREEQPGQEARRHRGEVLRLTGRRRGGGGPNPRVEMGSDESNADPNSEKKSGSFMDQAALETSEVIKNSPLKIKFTHCDADGLKKGPSGDVHKDTEEEHLHCPVGLVMKLRYQVVSTLGVGAFGKVVECVDMQKDERVAVKIVKKSESFCEVARSEISILEEINSLDDDHRFACVRMLDWFQHEGHICIVMELLGLSTFEFLRQNHFMPFSVEQIRLVAFQIFRAISFLHRNKLTHTDLKPENILFVSSDRHTKKIHERSPSRLDVKMVDFGSATFDHQHHETLVSTRHYRAPEVILGLGWNQSCDVWSLGCVLMEYYLGQTLFPSHDSREHLAMMEKVLGPIPSSLLQQARNQQYVKNQQLNSDEPSSSDKFIKKHCQPLKAYLRTSSEDEQQLFDLLSYMLEFDVSRRITAEEALWHRFFSPLRKHKQK